MWVLACRYDMLCKICIVHRSNQGNNVLFHADSTAFTRQHELEHTLVQIRDLSALNGLDHGVGIDYLDHLCDV